MAISSNNKVIEKKNKILVIYLKSIIANTLKLRKYKKK
jgi:hypothetical protein